VTRLLNIRCCFYLHILFYTIYATHVCKILRAFGFHG